MTGRAGGDHPEYWGGGRAIDEVVEGGRGVREDSSTVLTSLRTYLLL